MDAVLAFLRDTERVLGGTVREAGREFWEGFGFLNRTCGGHPAHETPESFLAVLACLSLQYN